MHSLFSQDQANLLANFRDPADLLRQWIFGPPLEKRQPTGKAKTSQATAYDDLVSMVLEIGHQNYDRSRSGKSKLRRVRFDIGRTVDFETCREENDAEPGLQRRVARADRGKRVRAQISARFTDPTPFRLQKDGGKLYDKEDYAWLGMNWLEKNSYRNPSKRQVLEGILLEVRNQFTSMKHAETETLRREVMQSRITAFEALFQLTGLSAGDLDDELQPEALHDPKDNTTAAFLLIYSLETFLPEAVNKATREKDVRRVDSLGPFVLVLRSIVNGAQEERTDDQKAEGDLTAWRSAILERADLERYAAILDSGGAGAQVRFMGFVSALTSQGAALRKTVDDFRRRESDANQDHNCLVLFKMTLDQDGAEYFEMNRPEYSLYHESERAILLQDSLKW